MSAKPSLEDRAVDGVVELTEEEWAKLLDREARERLGISGAEFRQRWESGEWADIDPDEERDVWDVAFYLGGWVSRPGRA